MNERIKELEKQAWDYAYDHETVKGNIANGGFINMNFSDAFSEKFAELIVRECGDIAYKAYWDNPETVRGIHIKEKIKQHFGVEND